MLNNLLNNVKTKINKIKEENKNYNIQLNNSTHFIGLQPLPKLPEKKNEKNINTILETCPDLNKEKAIIINKIIPTTENYLTIIYAKEIITGNDYWLIPTEKYLWIINEKEYGVLLYQNIKICNIIKNNIMSKNINLNNVILEINGNDEKINNFINILKDKNIREKIIQEKTAYLCNITPIYQNINKIGSGISIDTNNNIVFHTNKDNYKFNIKDLTNFELLVDNNPILSKNSTRNTHITSSQNTCYSISIKITIQDTYIMIPILEPNSLGKKYTIKDSIFQQNMNFAKEIINKLQTLTDNTNYN